MSIHHPEWTPDLDELPWYEDENGDVIEELPFNSNPNRECLRSSLPNMLTWPTEPEARAGDRFVFRWGRIQGINLDPEFPEHQGSVYSGTFPDIYIELTAHPIRHRKGHWQAPFQIHGFDRTVYMAPGGGTTTNPLRAIDDEVPMDPVKNRSVESDAADRKLRQERRREEERAEKEAERRSAQGPGTKARLTTQLGALDDAA